MQLLRGLRLNCFLAALIPSLMACLILAYQQHHHSDDLYNTYASEAKGCLHSYASLLANPQTRAKRSALINNADDRWLNLAIVSLNEDRHLTIDHLFGSKQQLIHDNPDPLLIKSLIEAQHWRIKKQTMAIASPILFEGKELGVLYGEITIKQEDKQSTLLIIVSAALLIAMLVAWYLSQRIYKPIESLCNETESIIHGKHYDASAVNSAETAHVASSINDLLALYQAQQDQISSLSSKQSSLDPDPESSVDIKNE